MIKLGAKTLSQRQVNVHHSMTHAYLSFYIYVLGYVPSIVTGCTMVSPLGHQWWYCRVVLWVISCSTAVSPFSDQWWYRVIGSDKLGVRVRKGTVISAGRHNNCLISCAKELFLLHIGELHCYTTVPGLGQVMMPILGAKCVD